MQIPAQIPGLKLLTVLTGIYAALWISLEGRVWRVVVMAVGVTAVSLLHLLQNKLGGRAVSLWQWLGITAVLGLCLGGGSGLLTLVFMAVKTGIHAHGPEFTLSQIQWVSQQTPLWVIVGLLTGIGLGMLTAKKS
jgi:hypothetical protein